MAFLDLTQLSKVRKSQPQGLSLCSADCRKNVELPRPEGGGLLIASQGLGEPPRGWGTLASSGPTARVGPVQLHKTFYILGCPIGDRNQILRVKF